MTPDAGHGPGQAAQRVDQAHGFGQARGVALEDLPGALGRLVPGPEAGASGGDDQARRSSALSRASSPATEATPSAITRALDHLEAGRLSASTSAAPERSSRVPATTPSDTVTTLAWRGSSASARVSRPSGGRRSAASRMARAAATGSGWPKMALPATKVSAPASAIGTTVSASIPPSTSMTRSRSSRRAMLRGPSDLGDHLRHEMLTTEARVHGHDEQQIDAVQPRLARLERGFRVDRQADVETEAAHGVDQLGRAVDLDMDAAVVGAGLGKASR